MGTAASETQTSDRIFYNSSSNSSSIESDIRTVGPAQRRKPPSRQNLRKDVLLLHSADFQGQQVKAYHLLEEKQHVPLLQQHRLQETEISTKGNEFCVLEEGVKKKSQSCQTLESELQNVLQRKTHLNAHSFTDIQKTTDCEQVKYEYERLWEALCAVTVERDCALWERTQLQVKLENLEQVLKHMREAAERRQQLELEHEQALAVLSAKQQEIDLLQKVRSCLRTCLHILTADIFLTIKIKS
ncbi:peripheral-type benzodiazepine receptor-associated protein 1-like [Silurus meridionalis]|uniref:peripheral-type benzodiazepine receptor-associated protein 1-like n=1 Tax=Silurus meridionalis TaxID=175797 RepID=UPI001EEABBBA|nr:peripheral-type benzodiazepine receptor-associated protein 1-like [Silurus meridionalis]